MTEIRTYDVSIDLIIFVGGSSGRWFSWGSGRRAWHVGHKSSIASLVDIVSASARLSGFFCTYVFAIAFEFGLL